MLDPFSMRSSFHTWWSNDILHFGRISRQVPVMLVLWALVLSWYHIYDAYWSWVENIPWKFEKLFLDSEHHKVEMFLFHREPIPHWNSSQWFLYPFDSHVQIGAFEKFWAVTSMLLVERAQFCYVLLKSSQLDWRYNGFWALEILIKN